MVPWAEIFWLLSLFFRHVWDTWLGIPEIVCFWDVDNLNIRRDRSHKGELRKGNLPYDQQIRRIVRQIHNLASNFTSSELVIRAYGNRTVNDIVRSALGRESSVRLHIVQSIDKNAADEEIVLAIRSWIKGKCPTFVILITGDGDYYEVLRNQVRAAGHYIVLVHPDVSVSKGLKDIAAKSLAWEKFQNGGLSVGADVGTFRGNIEGMHDVLIHFYIGWALYNKCSIECCSFMLWLIVSSLIVKPRLRTGCRHMWNRCFATPQCIFSRLLRSVVVIVEICLLVRLFMFGKRYAIILKIWYIAYGALKAARRQRRLLFPKQQSNQGDQSISVFTKVKIQLERDWAQVDFLIACIAMDMCGLY